jgi:exopolysaccharide biosynthesis polyprenyl glycosylphosphotransferase
VNIGARTDRAVSVNAAEVSTGVHSQVTNGGPTTLFAPAEAGMTNAIVVEPDTREVSESIGDLAASRSGTLRARLHLVALLITRNWRQSRLAVDALVLYLASSAALVTAISPQGAKAREWLALTFPPVVLALLHARSHSEERLHPSAAIDIANVFVVVSLAALVLVAIDSTIGNTRSISFVVPLWLFSLAFLMMARLALLSVHREALQDPALATPTLVVGGGDIAARLVSRLVGDRSYGLRPVGVLDAEPMPSVERLTTNGVPVLGGLEELADAVTLTGARHVILAFSSHPDHVLAAKIRECEELGLEVSVVPRLYECINERATLAHVGALPVLTLRPTDPLGWQFAVKHALDRCTALVALVALAPLLTAIALAVRLTSPGPVLFRQRRVGRDGREFDILKFRTMQPSVSANLFVPPTGCAPGGIEGEDRRTPIGRFLRDTALDELPQLINVLRGEMSLVGPRPERPEFVERFERDVYRYQDRHRVKSGMTGWAQVQGLRGQTPIADRVEWDNYYIQNWSLGLDLRILVLTVVELCRPNRES